MENLDLYFKYPPTQSNIWGAETFYALINALRRLGVIEINAYLVHREFRSIGNISMGNIYTALRDYHYDFGMIGIYILHSVFTIFISVYYEILNKSRGNYPIILGSMMYYSVATYMFTQEFFCNIISFGFLI